MSVHKSDARTYDVALDFIAPPPAYEESFKDAPPSYQSLFKQLKEAKRTSSTPMQFVRKFINILLMSVLCTVLIIFSLAIPVSMLVVGTVYRDDCPLEPRIPIYLLVAGACYVPKVFVDLVVRYCRSRHPDDEGSALCKIANVFQQCEVCFQFAFMIVGNVWVFGNYPPSDDEDSGNYCYGPLYYFAFWLMTVGYICLVSAFLCLGCVVLCLLGSSFFEDKT